MLWAMIILVSIGTGFFKGNVSGINGRLFPLADQDELDTVFNLQYMFVNIGSFCGTTFLSLVWKERWIPYYVPGLWNLPVHRLRMVVRWSEVLRRSRKETIPC